MSEVDLVLVNDKIPDEKTTVTIGYQKYDVKKASSTSETAATEQDETFLAE